jgi:hypothetical protein
VRRRARARVEPPESKSDAFRARRRATPRARRDVRGQGAKRVRWVRSRRRARATGRGRRRRGRRTRDRVSGRRARDDETRETGRDAVVER